MATTFESFFKTIGRRRDIVLTSQSKTERGFIMFLRWYLVSNLLQNFAVFFLSIYKMITRLNSAQVCFHVLRG